MSDHSASENFSSAHETQSYKILAGLGALLTVVFAAMGLLEVPNLVTHYLWFAFALASFGTTFVFSIAVMESK